MKIIIAGGKGHLGRILTKYFESENHDVHTLSRTPKQKNEHHWDGHTLGAWAKCIDGSDIVINLAGKSVNCRYTDKNLQQMLDSRVNSTHAIGLAIQKAKKPPKLWLQMSTATIYAHSMDNDNNEYDGTIGGKEHNVPRYWDFSVNIARSWEDAQGNCITPQTRQVALRTSMVMSNETGGVFSVLKNLTQFGLGGSIAGGRQYISWIHEEDFINAIKHILHNDKILGPINLSSPYPIQQKDFMRDLRESLNISMGLPASQWMAEMGAFFMGTDTELILKSRRVVPKKLLDSQFVFRYPTWRAAAEQLVKALK